MVIKNTQRTLELNNEKIKHMGKWVTDLNRFLTEEDIPMAKQCLTIYT